MPDNRNLAVLLAKRYEKPYKTYNDGQWCACLGWESYPCLHCVQWWEEFLASPDIREILSDGLMAQKAKSREY